MATKQETYTVPPEIAVALTTGRSDFARTLAKRVAAGEAQIDPRFIPDLIRLIADLVDDRDVTTRQMLSLKHSVHHIDDHLKGLDKRCDEMRALLRQAMGGNEIAPDEVKS